jgi:two-component system chemotaxis response regulator CheY
MMKSAISTSELSVFLVEPSSLQARIVKKYLSDLGVLNTQVFQDGTSALAAMRKQQPELTISSMYLDDMSGSKLVEVMRADQTLAGIAFILISSEDNPLYLDPVRQSGACAILTKPFELENLRTVLFTTLDYINLGSLALDKDSFDVENLHVLVVDDSSSARAYLIRVLKNIGIKSITEAENGKRGSEIIEGHSFDLVITDYNMPEMDGGELVEFIRNKSWQNTLPIVMITSERDEKRLDAVRQSGVTAICDKPFDPSQIKNLIEQIFTATH